VQPVNLVQEELVTGTLFTDRLQAGVMDAYNQPAENAQSFKDYRLPIQRYPSGIIKKRSYLLHLSLLGA